MAIVAANRTFDIYLSSTPPNQLRFRILNTNSSFKTRLSMYYSTSQRIDLYQNGVFVPPTNSYYVNGNMMLTDPGNNTSAFKPTISNNSGCNFFNTNEKKIYFTIDGSGYIDLIIAPVLYIKFGLPAMTPDTFFNPATIAGNFALLLGLNPSQIKIVKIIKANSRKRQTSSLSYVFFTISNNAPTTLTNVEALNNIQTNINQIGAKISNLYATGQLQLQAQTLLNVTLGSMNIQQAQANSTLQTVVKVAKLVVITQASNCKAQTPCQTQPVVMVVDENVRENYILFKLSLR
jgi:hypothetical protein